jgi:hypothetical protein
MEHLQQYIKDRFNTLKWDKDPNKDLWSTKQEITVNQGTMFINGQQIKQEGQKKTIGKSFEVTGMCEIKDLTTEKVDTCLQCSFNITDNDVEVQHLEINIYPGEMDYFNGLMAQIFRV